MTETAPRRAHSLAELGPLQSLMFRGEEMASGIAGFRPRPDDVVISPFGKCGTTWLQQTFHCLRTRGDMDFDDISSVVPWIETSVALGIDLDAPQRAAPRGFKSHLAYDALPVGARCVTAFREPKAALLSMYHFMEGWFFEPGTISLAEFAQTRLVARPDRPDYWRHLISWWGQRDNPDVLLLSYEGMSADPVGNIRRLAAFCGIPLDDDLLALTLDHSSRGFMLRHKDRFSDPMMRRLSEQRCNLPPDSDSAKVRAPEGREALSPEIDAAMDAIWTERVTAKLGFADYAALEADLRRRQGA